MDHPLPVIGNNRSPQLFASKIDPMSAVLLACEKSRAMQVRMNDAVFLRAPRLSQSGASFSLNTSSHHIKAMDASKTSRKDAKDSEAKSTDTEDHNVLSILKPDDFHVHLRDGQSLSHTAHAVATQFERALVMPNLKPPITTTGAALDYKARIMDCFSGNDQPSFTPLMTLYLTVCATPCALRFCLALFLQVLSAVFPVSSESLTPMSFFPSLLTPPSPGHHQCG